MTWLHQPYNSPAIGKFSPVRWLSGPTTSMARPPADHVVAHVTGEADEVGDDLQREGAGEGVDRLEGALLHEVGDESVSLGVDRVLEPRSARGVRFSVRAARSSVCAGGSEASDVPCSAPLTIGLKPRPTEEKDSQSVSASRMTS